jgi:MFS family permease
LGKGIRTAPRDAIIAESVESTHLGRAFSFHRAMDTLGAVVGPAITFGLLGIFNNDYRQIFWISMVPGVIAVILIIFFIQERKKQPKPEAERPKLTLNHFDWKMKFFIVIATIFALGNSSDAFLILRAQQVGIPVATIPVVYLVFNLFYSLSAIPAGMAADKFGKKRIILLGFVLFAGLYYGFAVAKAASTIWLLFGLYGLFMGFTEGIQKAFLATIIPPDFKATAFGVYAAVVGLAMLPASLIAGWLWDHVSPASTFYFGAATATLAAILFSVLILLTRFLQPAKVTYPVCRG